MKVLVNFCSNFSKTISYTYLQPYLSIEKPLNGVWINVHKLMLMLYMGQIVRCQTLTTKYILTTDYMTYDIHKTDNLYR